MDHELYKEIIGLGPRKKSVRRLVGLPGMVGRSCVLEISARGAGLKVSADLVFTRGETIFSVPVLEPGFKFERSALRLEQAFDVPPDVIDVELDLSLSISSKSILASNGACVQIFRSRVEREARASLPDPPNEIRAPTPRISDPGPQATVQSPQATVQSPKATVQAPSLVVRRPEAESPGAAELPARHSAVEDGADRLGGPDALGEAPGEDARGGGGRGRCAHGAIASPAGDANGVACERWVFESSFERLCGSGSGLSSEEPDGASAARSPPAQREEGAEGPLSASRLRRAVQNGWKFARKRGASGQTGHRDADGGGVDGGADLGVGRAESLSPARDQEAARIDDAAGAAGTSLPRRSFFGAGRGERRDKSAGGECKEGKEGKEGGETAAEDVEEVVWTEDNKVPANGSKGEILIKSPGRYLLALNSKPSRFVPNRALGYVITIHSAHKGLRLELGNPEFLSCEEYFVVRDEDVPCRATWTIWSHAIFKNAVARARLVRLSYVAAARADMKEGQQWLVPSPDGGCPEDREEEEQDVITRLIEISQHTREAVQPVLGVFAICCLSWLNELWTIPIPIPGWEPLPPLSTSLRAITACSALAWCYANRDEVMHEVLRLREDYRSYRAVKKLNTRAQELTVRMKNKGIWGKVKLMRSEYMRTLHERGAATADSPEDGRDCTPSPECTKGEEDAAMQAGDGEDIDVS